MADTCPKCGFNQVPSDRCPRCGIVIALYTASLEKMRRGPRPPAPSASTATSAPPVAGAWPGSPGVIPRNAVSPGSLGTTTPPAFTGRAPAPSRPATTAAEPATSGSRRARFMGSGATLFGIHIVNMFLTLLTLGVYVFWGKVRVRRYLWSETEFEGDRFAFHGTGGEMLVGFLKALVFIIPITVLNVLPDVLPVSELIRGLMLLGVYVLAGIFVPMAMIGARRYRLSRTSWRGIRFSLRARTKDFVRLWGWNTFLVVLSLGLFYPVYITRRYEFMTRNMWFGSQRFGFDGRGRDLFWPFLGMLVLFPLTLGLSWFWYAARKSRYFAAHTTFAAARFASTVRALPLAWLTLSNVIVLILTLGLAWPWISVRSLRFTYANLSLEGPLALDAITQQAQQVSATGEGLAGFLDADLGLT
jgi:uncharacterized membrane protein YjgN (DUF898 family)